jgi:hypothetical protein
LGVKATTATSQSTLVYCGLWDHTRKRLEFSKAALSYEEKWPLPLPFPFPYDDKKVSSSDSEVLLENNLGNYTIAEQDTYLL